MSFLGKLRGAFDWVPRPVAREFWWFVLVFMATGFIFGGTSSSPRTGGVGGVPGSLTGSEGPLDALGYWALPVVFVGVYVVVIALRLIVRRVRGGSVDQVAREIREKQRRNRPKG